MKEIKVQGTFVNNTDSNIIAYAEQIYDKSRGKSQKTINDELSGSTKSATDLNYKNVTIEPLVVGTFEDSTSNNHDIENIISSSNTRASTPSVTLVPYPEVEFLITLPENIRLRIYYANQLEHASSKTITSGYYSGNNNGGWWKNGDIVKFGKEHLRYRLLFKQVDSNGNDIAITPIDDLNSFIASGSIALKYKSNDGTVISRNVDKETHVRMLMSSFNSASRYMEGMAVLTHISDLHGDIERLKNILEYSDLLDADAVLNSGDAAYMDYRNNGKYQLISKNYSPKYLTCIGNHEVWRNTNGTTAPAIPTNFIRDNYITPYAEDNEYILNNSITTETYYYVDFEDKKLRIIVLDTHYENCYGNNINNRQGGSAGDSIGGRIGKAQFEWFVSTLQNTPANYGVVLMYHENERPIEKSSIYSKFYANRITKSAVTGNTYNYNGNGFASYSTRPISKIIDAFISKTSITLSAAESDATCGTAGSNGTVIADFTNLNANVEFICHICGHTHIDTVGYYKKDVNEANIVNDQLVLNISTGSPFEGGANPYGNFDLPRYWQGVTQDAFNVYVIDRYKKCVRIARIGSNQTYDEGEGHDSYMRDFMDIPYDNSNS